MKRNLDEIRQEVERITDGAGKRVDEKIKPLVIGLRWLGFETQNSCQGHFTCLLDVLKKPWYCFRGFHLSWSAEDCLPWVQITIHSGDRERIEKLLSMWTSSYQWIFEGLTDEIWRLRPQGRWWNLRELQRESLNLGFFLQQLPEDLFDRLEGGGS